MYACPLKFSISIVGYVFFSNVELQPINDPADLPSQRYLKL